jgi:hypothetical protein
MERSAIGLLVSRNAAISFAVQCFGAVSRRRLRCFTYSSLRCGFRGKHNQVIDMVEDSLLLAGSEAYSAALACYQSAKTAAKLNVAGAATIVGESSSPFDAARIWGCARQFRGESGTGTCVASCRPRPRRR